MMEVFYASAAVFTVIAFLMALDYETPTVETPWDDQ